MINSQQWWIKGSPSIQSNSGASTIVSGNGGQIQLSGFNRETDLDGAFSSSISDRENDALKNTDVNFYMYTNGNTETNVTTPLAPNGYHLYSPNVSEFKIQTTRPYFSWTGDISNAIKISEANADFDDLLGLIVFKYWQWGRFRWKVYICWSEQG